MAEPTKRTSAVELPVEVADMAAAMAKLYTLAVRCRSTTVADVPGQSSDR